MKKQIWVFVFCTIISLAMILAGANSITFALMMPLIFNAVYSVESVHANSYCVALTLSLNMALGLIFTKDLFTAFCVIPMLAVSGILVGISALKNLGRYPAILGGVLATGGIYVAYIIYSINVLGINPVIEMFSIMEQVLYSMTTTQDMPIDVGVITEYIALTRNFYVAIMIIAFAFIGYFIAYFTAFVLNMFKECKSVNLTFSEFKADGVTVFVYLIAIIASYLVEEGVIAVALTNVYIVLNYYLVICGASVIYYLIKNKMRAPMIIRKLLGVIVLSVSFSGFASIILVLIALWDARRDFRRLNRVEE